jgi:hypothetical protein
MCLLANAFSSNSMKTVSCCNNRLNFATPCPRDAFYRRRLDCPGYSCVDEMAFFDLPTLTTLELDGNDFSGVNPKLFLRLFGGLRNLQSLSLGYCKIKSLFSDVFGRFPHL